MLKLLILQQFPSCTVTTMPDPYNSGNFVVEAVAGMGSPQQLLSPYGFLTPAMRMRELLHKISKLPASTAGSALSSPSTTADNVVAAQ